MIRVHLRGLLLGALALGLVHAPRAAHACAVCTAGRDDETRFAFQLTTLFLSVLPVAMVGGLVWWIVRRARALERRRGAHEPGAVGRAPSSP